MQLLKEAPVIAGTDVPRRLPIWAIKRSGPGRRSATAIL